MATEHVSESLRQVQAHAAAICEVGWEIKGVVYR